MLAIQQPNIMLQPSNQSMSANVSKGHTKLSVNAPSFSPCSKKINSSMKTLTSLPVKQRKPLSSVDESHESELSDQEKDLYWPNQYYTKRAIKKNDVEVQAFVDEYDDEDDECQDTNYDKIVPIVPEFLPPPSPSRDSDEAQKLAAYLLEEIQSCRKSYISLLVRDQRLAEIMVQPQNQPQPQQVRVENKTPCGPGSRPFIPKIEANHSKSNFFISKEKTTELLNMCAEPFHSFKQNDEGLLFSYFKQSVAMSINDKQVRIIESVKGDIVVLDIDLHFKNGQSIFLVAIQNDKDHVAKMKWRVAHFLTKQALFETYPGVTEDYLPKPSRKMDKFQRGLASEPSAENLFNAFSDISYKKLHKKPKKYRSNKDQQGPNPQNKITISFQDFLYYCRQTIASGNYQLIPVVVVKGAKTWIEWKLPIHIVGYGYMCVSLKWTGNNRLTIACLDFDAGSIYYKHRLVGNPEHCQRVFSYQELKKYCTISLDIVKESH